MTPEPAPLRFASANQLRSARKLVRRKDRTASNQFLVEGPQAVREALAAEAVATLLVSSATPDRHVTLVETAQRGGAAASLVSPADLAALTDTVNPQGVVAIAGRVDVGLAAALAGAPRLVVCCAQVRDPGNAGTVIRCADAFGADAVILTEGSVDVYNPKTVRASAGSLFHLPLVVAADLADTVAGARERGLQVLAADGDGVLSLPELAAGGQLARPTLWLMGNEAWGLPEDQRALADGVVQVPLYGRAESLNLSTAAAVCLYASASAQRAG